MLELGYVGLGAALTRFLLKVGSGMVWVVWDVECRADEAADVGCWVEGWDVCVCEDCELGQDWAV